MDTKTRLLLLSVKAGTPAAGTELAAALDRAGFDQCTSKRLLATLPLAGEDNTAGSETELQAAVRGTGQLGCLLFLAGEYLVVYVTTITVTQLWRVVSEFLRADFRGTGRLTAYQWMGLAALPYALAVAMVLPAETIAMPVIGVGLAALWTPVMLLGLQGLWLLIFFTTGCSSVTGATLDFHVHHERI